MTVVSNRRRLAMVATAVALGIWGSAFGAAAGPTPTAAFLDRYMEPDGRVVRLDHGGDTVSEGQAYAMLAAAAIGDRARFDRAWNWAQANLQRPDRLLAWHWDDGRVVDSQPAADADLDAAHALVLAGRRFGDPSLTTAGVRMGAAILAHETVVVAGQRILAAGPWAIRSGSTIVNPSYYSPAAYSALWRVNGDTRWTALANSARSHVDALTARGTKLPPDWAVVDSGGTPTPAAGPDGRPGFTFGFDAVRVPIRFAVACDVATRSRAAALGQAIGSMPPVVSHHASGHVARGATDLAQGNLSGASSALADAAWSDRAWPTYYGAAWLALGESWFRARPCS